MCFDIEHDNPRMPKEGVGYKVFKNSYGSLYSAVLSNGPHKRNVWLKAASFSGRWEMEGWYIFKTLNGAKRYLIKGNSEVIHKVEYRDLIGTGSDVKKGVPRIACRAKEMRIKEEITLK